MAYKFQLGSARLSGSTTFEQALVGESTISASSALQGASLTIAGAASGVTTLAASGLASLDGGINVNDDFTVDTDGGVVAVGINAGGALSGVTTLAASGLASIASISMDDGSTLGPDSVADLWTFNADGDTTQKNGAYDFDLASHDGTNGLKLGGVLVNASAADLNFTNVAAAGTAEASKALVVDASKNIGTLGQLTASVLSASNLYGDGSGLTGISSDTVDTTTDSTSATYYVPFVDQATGADGETLRIHSAVAVNPSTGVFTIAGSAPEFVIGSAALNEADMEKLDGITNGTAAASKAVVLDASKDIAGLNDVSAAGLTLSDLTDERLAIVGASGLLQDNALFNYNDTRNPAQGGYVSIHVSSSASGSSYLQDGMIGVYDASNDLVFRAKSTGVRSDVAVDIRSTLDVSGLSTVGAITSDGAIEFQSTSNFQGHVDCDTTFNVDGLSTMAAITSDGALAVSSTISGSSTLKVGGNVTMAGLGNKTVALQTDLMIVGSGSSGLIKTTSLASYSTAIAGAGLLSTAGIIAIVNSTNGGINVAADAINLDFNDLSAGAAVNVAADSFAFLDADGDVTMKESIADLATAMAGTGITATNGQFSVSQASTPTAFGDEAATMVEGLNYASAALTAARVLTLPNSDDLDVGEFVKIKMAAGLTSTIYASIVIAVGSGDLIDGDASIRLESPFAAVNLYKVAENIWRIL